jgi:hypothetical protein
MREEAIRPVWFSVVVTTVLAQEVRRSWRDLFRRPVLEQPPTIVRTLAASREWVFADLFRYVLGTTMGKMRGSHELIDRGYVLTFAQVRDIVNDYAETADVVTSGYGNFFLVQTGIQDSPVGVVRFAMCEGSWLTEMHPYDYSLMWQRECRIFVPNLAE